MKFLCGSAELASAVALSRSRSGVNTFQIALKRPESGDKFRPGPYGRRDADALRRFSAGQRHGVIRHGLGVIRHGVIRHGRERTP